MVHRRHHEIRGTGALLGAGFGSASGSPGESWNQGFATEPARASHSPNRGGRRMAAVSVIACKQQRSRNDQA